MSWNFGISGVPQSDVEQRLKEKAAESIQQYESYGGLAVEDCRAQMNAAVDAVVALVTAGVVGGTDARFTIAVGGHSNADHAPAKGWANDALNIRISQD